MMSLFAYELEIHLIALDLQPKLSDSSWLLNDTSHLLPMGKTRYWQN